ncbi:MAG: ABC transporter permease [Lachnospiraceae bacterium]|nr:ABC transporter permease [Lachnospiraceae bacterium]
MHILKKSGRLSLRKKICLMILGLYLLTAFLAPWIMPYKVTDFSHPSLEPPCAEYLLGTDEMGHDIFSMLINGFRLTVALSLISGFLSTFLGTFLAFLAGYLGKLADEILTMAASLFLIVPELVVIMFVAVFARPTMLNTVLVIVLFSWPRVFKITRSKLSDCMNSSKVRYTMMMKGNVLDVIRKLLPDILPVIQSFFILQCNKAVMYETTLSFFGIGDPLAKTWGKLIRAAMDYEDLYYDNTFLWYLLPPILVVIVFTVSLALLVTEET